MSNQQPIDGISRLPGGFLMVHHIFPTIQGEGPFAGTPAIFVRLFGCNLQCPACDTDYTSRQELLSPIDIHQKVWDYCPLGWFDKPLQPPKANRILVVITGGEPFRQNLVPAVEKLIQGGFRVQIETNGTLWNPDMAVLCGLYPQDLTIVCSPKTGRIHEGIAAHAKHFKYILQYGQVEPVDGLPTSTMMKTGAVARPPAGVTVYVQPLDEEFIDPDGKHWIKSNPANLQVCKDSAMRHGYNLSVQTHKIANLE